MSISLEQARKLKQQPATPKGRRDALLMCLLLEHGLRCGEIADLNVRDINLDAGGWSSPAMPLRYAESSKIANSGVKLTM